MPRAIQELTDLISSFPGVGPRQARRIVHFLLHSDGSYRKKVSEKILTITEHIESCTSCFRYEVLDADRLCPICADKSRARETIMVVEKDVDIEGIETSGAYMGQYFVLGSLFSFTHRKKMVTPRTGELLQRIKRDDEVREVIFAFAATPEGDLTASELKEKKENECPKVTTSTLGRGLSIGAEIEYADQETIKDALKGRRPL